MMRQLLLLMLVGIVLLSVSVQAVMPSTLDGSALPTGAGEILFHAALVLLAGGLSLLSLGGGRI